MSKNLLSQLVETGSGTGVFPLAGPRANEVWWAHVCPRRNRWAYTGVPNHTLTGSVEDGSLTIRASLICEDCGKHGWLTNMQWSEA